jgi:hypothetical protein
MIDLDAGGDQVKNLQKEVGGVFDIVGHRECDLVINDEGRINASPVNVRARIGSSRIRQWRKRAAPGKEL